MEGIGAVGAPAASGIPADLNGRRPSAGMRNPKEGQNERFLPESGLCQYSVSSFPKQVKNERPKTNISKVTPSIPLMIETAFFALDKK